MSKETSTRIIDVMPRIPYLAHLFAFYTIWYSLTIVCVLGSYESLLYWTPSPLELVAFIGVVLLVPCVVTIVWVLCVMTDTWSEAIEYDARHFKIQYENEVLEQVLGLLRRSKLDKQLLHVRQKMPRFAPKMFNARKPKRRRR